MRAYLAGSIVLWLSACGGSAYSERDVEPRETETQSNQPAPPPASPADTPGNGRDYEDTPAADPGEGAAPPFAGNGGLQAQDDDLVCTDIGCLSGFQLTIDKQTPWQPGSYSIVARGDNGLERRCDLYLTALDMLVYEGCDGFFLTRQDDKPVPASAQIQLVSDEIEVEVLFDGARLALARYEPGWAEHRPNGPRCEPVCTNGGRQVLGIE